MWRDTLIAAAKDARESAYAPYSKFRVGAALLTKDRQIFRGCNIENVSFSATNCAERTAVYTAVSQGVRDFTAIAIISDRSKPISPCGICRQVLIEFCQPDFLILMCGADGEYREITLGQLMPEAFSDLY